MRYRINDNVALRSWRDIPHAYYAKGSAFAAPLSKKEFLALLLCDGSTDLGESAVLRSLEERGFISPCEPGNAPSAWSRLMRCDNAYMPKMNLMITGKCNFNCLHCFNAADNAPLMSEWGYDDLLDLLDQARDCGINAFTITGGEPMMHPRFMDILRAIYDRGMYVDMLNTNGFFITQEILDEMRAMGCTPAMKISFDGAGFHDWMRARKGAEQRTLAAIALCIENGFEVRIQTQVNRRNLESMPRTVSLMEEMGASSVRLIRTSEADRWRLNAGDASLPFEEYYAGMIDLAARYAAEAHAMQLVMWQLMTLFPQTRGFTLHPVMHGIGEYNPKAPVCQGNRAMVAVSADGEILPCMQMGGYFLEHGMSYGNVHDTPLRELLSGGEYLRTVCRNVGELRAANSRCGSCRFFECCCGGCRALGYLLSGEGMDGSDLSKCLFFNGGWYARAVEALPGWTSLSPIPDELVRPWDAGAQQPV